MNGLNQLELEGMRTSQLSELVGGRMRGWAIYSFYVVGNRTSGRVN